MKQPLSRYIRVLSISLPLSLLLVVGLSFSQNEAPEEETQPVVPPEVKAENQQKCLNCHASAHYTMHNSDSTETRKKAMFDEMRIHPEEFYASNHKTFMCIDCHTPEYETYPHPVAARFEMQYNCIDCHYMDPTLEEIDFVGIENEYHESVHHTRLADDFACWDCHDPHTYSLTARNNPNITEVVAYDNKICLNCHIGEGDYQLLTTQEQPEIMHTHEWLPNAETHFKKVRCLECHTQLSDSLLVAHNIRPKEEAVKRCEECHSQNSLLMSSLYKHKVQENREENGFMNAVILNDAYVIGANRNTFLNKASVVLFILVVLVIALHATLRYVTRKKRLQHDR